MTDLSCIYSLEEKPLILLVDDIPENLQILHQILNTGEYSFALASSGREALKLVDKKMPDLILLDIMMNDINGYEVCQQLKKEPPKDEIPIIFLTAKVEVEDKVKGFEMGAVDYITKPFEAAEVAARVRTHVRLKRTVDMVKECNLQLSEHLGDMLFSFNELSEAQQESSRIKKITTFKTITEDASHEINQPLTVLQGYMDMLRESIDPNILTATQLKCMDRMDNSLKKVMITVENFRRCSHFIDS